MSIFYFTVFLQDFYNGAGVNGRIYFKNCAVFFWKTPEILFPQFFQKQKFERNNFLLFSRKTGKHVFLLFTSAPL